MNEIDPHLESTDEQSIDLRSFFFFFVSSFVCLFIHVHSDYLKESTNRFNTSYFCTHDETIRVTVIND